MTTRLSETITTPAAANLNDWHITNSGFLWAFGGSYISINTVYKASLIEWGTGASISNPAIVANAPGGTHAPSTTYTVAVTYDVPPPGFIPTPSGDCVRRAWLTLQQASSASAGQLDEYAIELHNPSRGWVCTSLNLGYPEVRAVTNNRPDQNGIDDRTRFFGARAMSADIVVLASLGARIDERADDFARFMVPWARPTLHWILDRGDNPERMITVRPAEYAWAVETDYERDVHLAWVASDPIVRSATISSRTAWAGSTTGSGRTYNLTFPRTYPAGGGTGGYVLLTSSGDVPFYPLYRIYGPITAPRIQVNVHDATIGSGITSYIRINFLASFTINAGEWVDVDSANKTAFRNSNPQQSVQSQIDWNATQWGGIPPNPSNGSMGLFGSSTSGVTQVTAYWNDGFLS